MKSEPPTLMIVLTSAALLAFLLAPMAARFAVIVVPMLQPKTSGKEV